MANKYVGAAQFVGEKIIKPIVKSFTKKQKTTGTEVIKSVRPNVPKTKSEKAKSKLAIAKQETKGSQAKLNQTIFNFQEQNRQFKKDRVKKMVGGFMGKRKEFKKGTPKKKSKLEKIKKTFGANKKTLGMQSVIYGLDKNPKITAADPKAKFIAAANKKKKKVV